MTENNDEIKSCGNDKIAILADNRLSDCAKLVALLIAEGITDKFEIARMLNKSVRTIEPAYVQARRAGHVETRNHAIRENAKSRNDCISDEYANTRNHVEENAFSRNGTDVAISASGRAPKELPIGNNTSFPASKLAGGAGGFEIEGLNGSTGALVSQLAGLLATDLGNPDYQFAREILASNTAIYGPEKVKAGLAEWAVKVGTKKTSKSPSALVGFFKQARTAAATTEPDWKREKREQYDRIRAIIEA